MSGEKDAKKPRVEDTVSSLSDIYRKAFYEYRPSVRVIDCTIRDGGLMNKWRFTDDFVRAVYEANVAAGVDYMEIGYFTSEKYFKRSEVGPWRFCATDDLRRIVGENKTGIKLAGMADIGRIDPCDIPMKKDSLLDLVRVACYNHQIDEAIELANLCLERGYEVSINLMAVAKNTLAEIDACLEKVAKTKVHMFYLADSFGSLYGEQVRLLIRRYVEALPGKQIGFHGHHNQQLGMANSIDAITEGANMVDGSILGLGRGAGNTPTENVLCFLRNPKYNVRPIFDVVENQFYELKKTVEWGLSVPYLIAGVRNEHPKEAMAWEAAGKSKDGLGFYDKFVAADGAKDDSTRAPGGDPDMPDACPEGPRVPNHDSELYRKEFHTYKPMIKVMDNTIRDGGLINNWKFSDDFVKAVYNACVAAGVDYMEVGYFSTPGTYTDAGPWRHCRDADLRRVMGDNKTSLKLSAMVDVGRITADDIPHSNDTLIDMVRVAFYHNQVEEAVKIANACTDKGFEVGLLFMALSSINKGDVVKALDVIADKCRCNFVYIADSYGSLYCEQVEMLAKLFQQKLPGRIVGFHGKNNQHMAFANTIQAICTLEGVAMVDSSIMGLARGAGITPTENMMMFLKNPKFKLRPILEAIQTHVQQLADDLEWGPSMALLYSGARNMHPRDAMAWHAAGKRLDGARFIDSVASKAARPRAVAGAEAGGRAAPPLPEDCRA
eukprot:CAMPEP_0174282902 /NCGR_PEP_ID=MMETSP0809-20121228/3484_1 /TAXON_ID=73025 ORGANISM="Eutreptiella gymnastica-like, Strain CCMP1594" /NCGR_SAMPLE_ID=MMETSP0809 /ASSEMBLY_ACC=CAM_ASM_000658 /LENGTH=719 /DNA_ID=CAMNT_0015377423 /DNA_START=32 /DNA_END=2191 /DNA_ORIENTATION=+